MATPAVTTELDNGQRHWRTVATCVVVGGGTLAFSFVNGLFDRDGNRL